MIYTTESSGAYRTLAEEIAADANQDIVTRVPTQSSGLVTCVLPPDELEHKLVIELQERLAELGPCDGGFGIITGLTPEDACSLYNRTNDGGENHGLLFRKVNENWHSYDDETSVLIGEDATVSEIRQLADEGLDSLSLMTNGRAIHLFLTGGYICGVSDTVQFDSFDGPKPFCVEGDEANCPLDGDILRAESLAANHMFVNSCAPAVPGGSLSGLPFQVGMGLLNQVTSLIGSSRAGSALPQETLLHYCLLREGYNTTERCYILNKNSKALGIQETPYLSFGRPSSTVADPEESSYDIELTHGNDSATIDVYSFNGRVIDITIQRQHFCEDPPFFVTNESEALADAPLYYTAFEEDDDIRVLIYSWGRFESKHMRFRLTPEPKTEPQYKTLLTALENADTLNGWGLLDQKATGQLKDFHNQVNGLAEYVRPLRYRTNAYREFQTKLDRVEKCLGNIRNRVVSDITQKGRGDRISSEYFSRRASTETRDGYVECPNCGEPAFLKRSKCIHGGERITGNCSFGYTVFDAPVVGNDLYYPNVIVDDFIQVDSDATIDFQVEFENPFEREIDATFVPKLYADQEELPDQSVVTPSEERVTIGPREQRAIDFEVNTGIVPDNEYHINAYVISNLSVYFGSVPFVIGERVGHRS